jgi:hypothetical protein
MIPLQRRLGQSTRRPSWASKTAPPERGAVCMPGRRLGKRSRTTWIPHRDPLSLTTFGKIRGESPACC